MAGTFRDMDQFYDSVKPGRLINLAVEQGLKARRLFLPLQVHLAPRFVRVGGCCSDIIEVSSSLLAGCKFSNGFARSLGYSVLEKVHSRGIRNTLFRQFVDDLAQSTRGMNLKEVRRNAIEATVAMKAEIEKEELGVSSKTRIVCSSGKLQEEVIGGLRRRGINLKQAKN